MWNIYYKSHKMQFRTKLDFSSNRQVKQYPETNTVLSGATSFGVPFSALTAGPDLTTTANTATLTSVTSTFSGNSSVTNYNWFNGLMSIGSSSLSALTPSNSGITQYVDAAFSASSVVNIDGNIVATAYTGVSYDITPTTMINLGGGNFSGTVLTNTLKFYSAGSLDFTGRTIWVDVSGITRTNKLMVMDVDTGPSVIDVGIDATGMVVNQASDARLKTNILPITNALNTIKSINGVSFNWVDTNKGGTGRRFGTIAQQVNEVLPQLVYQSPDGYFSVRYDDITALLIEAVKQLPTGTTGNSNLFEENTIVLNYSGDNKTAVGGGIIIQDGIDDGQDSEFIIDNNGNWVTNNALIPNSFVVPEYTPSSSEDPYGLIGELTRDDNFLYLKISNGLWKCVPLTDLTAL